MADTPIHRLFGDLYRMASIEPDAARLELRWKSIVAFTSRASIDVWLDTLRFLFDLRSSAEPPVPLLRTACFERDPSFPSHGADAELKALAAAAILHGMESVDAYTVPLALGLQTGHCRGHRSLGPFANLLERARDVLFRRAVDIRRRRPLVLPKAEKNAEFTKVLEELPKFDQPPQIRDAALSLFTALQTEHREIRTQVGKVVVDANHDFTVLAEESNILWWVLSEHCQALGQPVAALSASVAAIVLAQELSDLTQFVPAPHASEAFLGRLIKRTPNPTVAVTLGDAVTAIDVDWRTALHSEVLSQRTADLTPVLVALAKSLDGNTVADWQASYQRVTRLTPAISLEPQALALQMLDELTLVRSLPKPQP